MAFSKLAAASPACAVQAGDRIGQYFTADGPLRGMLFMASRRMSV